jgi:hypothetical protein
MSTKKCNDCNEEKDLNCFYFRKNKNTYEGKCKECNARIVRERRQNNDDVKESVKKSQKKYYLKNKDRLNGQNRAYQEENKDRLSTLHKQYYQDNSERLKEMARENREHIKEKILAGQLEKPKINEKTCTKCSLTKDISNFTFRKTRNIYESVCKECNTMREREHRRLKKGEINARRKEIRKPLTNEQKIKRDLRFEIIRCIKDINFMDTYIELTDCDSDFLAKWFEYNFELDEQSGMSWDNYGSHWHIDHVTPCASFDMTDEDEQKKCFHWTNLSPVLKEYNLSKGSKIKPIDRIKQDIRIKKFLKKIEEDDILNKKYKMKYTLL